VNLVRKTTISIVQRNVTVTATTGKENKEFALIFSTSYNKGKGIE